MSNDKLMLTSAQLLDSLKKLENRLGPSASRMGRDLWQPASLGGLDVYTLPPEPPKLKLSESANVSDGFRGDFDQWLLERFGYCDPLFPATRAFLYSHREPTNEPANKQTNPGAIAR